MEAHAKRQSALQGAKRRQNFSQELSSFSTAPTLHFSGFAHQRHGLMLADSDLVTTAHTSSSPQHKGANRA